jgi:hypothetical protein
MKAWIVKHRINLLSMATYIVLFGIAAVWICYGAGHLNEWTRWLLR